MTPLGKHLLNPHGFPDQTSVCSVTPELTTPATNSATYSARRQLNTVVPACRLGILSLLCWPEGLVVGGGDGTVTTFDANMNDTCQVQLSGPVASLSFSPDKVEVIAGTSTGE